MAFDDAGNVYATDAHQGMIWKVGKEGGKAGWSRIVLKFLSFFAIADLTLKNRRIRNGLVWLLTKFKRKPVIRRMSLSFILGQMRATQGASQHESQVVAEGADAEFCHPSFRRRDFFRREVNLDSAMLHLRCIAHHTGTPPVSGC
jgi:hypothetical protein